MEGTKVRNIKDIVVNYSNSEDLFKLSDDVKFKNFILDETLNAIESAILDGKQEVHILNVVNYRFKIIIKRDQFESAIENIIKKYEQDENYDRCSYLAQLIKKI
jgi:hypothetical protein